MKLGIMQPYFVPYIGYCQLLNAVDEYIIYDNVIYIKSGWINRNRILHNGIVEYFNIPLKGASSNKLINEIEVSDDLVARRKMITTLEYAYKKSPFFADVMPMMEKIVNCKEKNLAFFLKKHLEEICGYLGISTQMKLASEIECESLLTGQERVIHICELCKADEYYNAIGGKELYSVTAFRNRNITLHFLENVGSYVYTQNSVNFEANLSIIDIMMNCSIEDIRKMLLDYKLYEECD